MSYYKAEYIWLDGYKPTALLRSKTKVIPKGAEPPIWGFDGSSTKQAPGDQSDCVLNPVYTVPDPIRGGDSKLVLCEVLNTDMSPHPTNTRAKCKATDERYAKHEPWFGLEQEYTLFKGLQPLGFPELGYPLPQGRYYCGVGSNDIFGREIAEEHLDACLYAGLKISGINAEVMPGQWEFQIGPKNGIDVSDQIIIARWLLNRISEEYDVWVSFDGKPVKGDWNGAGCHTNFSTKEMREAYAPIEAGCEALAEKAQLHVENYGAGIETRLTGLHETCSHRDFRWGVSDRGASIRIPWQVAKEQKGYLEDRRPNANCDPYVVTQLITDTVCAAM